MGKLIEVGPYSFADVECTIQGPFGLNVFTSGETEGGYSFEFEGDKGNMVRGAGGAVMMNLMVGQPGFFILRLQKHGSLNAILSTAYTQQTQSAATYSQNRIVVRDFARGDNFTAQACAFQRHPNTVWANNGGEMEWRWMCGYIGPILGSGVNQIIAT